MPIRDLLRARWTPPHGPSCQCSFERVPERTTQPLHLSTSKGIGSGALRSATGWLVAMGFGAAALGKRFRIYSLVSLAAVVMSFALGLSYVPEANAGQPMPFIGLEERIGFSAYFLWMTVLAVALWRRPTIKERDGELEDHRRPSAVEVPSS
jgi:hypothetical protein